VFKLPRARIAAPVLHASLFAIASLLILFSNHALLDGPAGVPVTILWIADIPISLIAFARLFNSSEYAKLTWVVWGVIGTAWWYFLGISIEAWINRLSKRT